jgi:hypothetical protein
MVKHTRESRIKEMIEIAKELQKRGIPVPDELKKASKGKAKAEPKGKKPKEAGDTSGLKKVSSLKNAKTALNEDV